MKVKSISSKLDFLENLIVEMNPENLEGLKTLSLEKISEINNELNLKNDNDEKNRNRIPANSK